MTGRREDRQELQEPQESENLTVREGYIHSLVFYNDDNGYAVLRQVLETGEIVTVTGCVPGATPGEHLLVRGILEEHPQYGEQLRAIQVERSLPVEEDGICTWLVHVCSGIGEVTARRIVDRYGKDTLEVLEEHPGLLAEIPGVTSRKAQELGVKFRQQMGLRHLLDFLRQNGLPEVLAVELRRQYGEEALSRVKRNPYLLAREEYGVEFSTLDAVALNLGISHESSERIRAGVIHELLHNADWGHVFLSRRNLENATMQLLHCEREPVECAVDDLADLQEVVLDRVAGLDVCYLERMWTAETDSCERILRLLEHTADESGQARQVLEEIQREQGIVYAPRQREAVELAAKSAILLITGGPGTGKTTSIRGIVALFQKMGLTTVLAAPTGRAAQRLGELTGVEAQTVHRLLGMRWSSGRRGTFARNEEDPLDAEAVIVDEMSMVDLPLFSALLRALQPGTRLVLVGDADQLPSVGAGMVFSDLIRSKKMETVFLQEIFRQAEQSAIIRNAHEVNCGRMPRLINDQKDFFFLCQRDVERAVNTVVELCHTRLPEKMGIPAEEIQVLTPMRKGAGGSERLNRLLQAALNPHDEKRPEIGWDGHVFRQNDRVMQIRNNYDILWERPDGTTGSGVFNGDVGRIVELDPSGEYLVVQYDDRRAVYTLHQLGELDLAYAQTVHKAQGSEYRCVVLCVMPGPSSLMVRSVLYTALTRARELLVMVGDDVAVRMMTANNRQQRRYSGLKWRLSRKKASLPPRRRQNPAGTAAGL